MNKDRKREVTALSKTIYPIRGGTEGFPFVLSCIRENNGSQPLKCPAGLDVCTLVITSAGSGRVCLPDGEHSISAGNVFFAAAKVPFELIPSPGGQTARHILFSSRTGLTEGLGLGDFFCADDVKTGELLTVSDRLAEIAADPLASAEAMSAALYELILAVRRAVLMKNDDRYGSGENIREALKYMDKYYSQEITLERLAVMSGVSLQHFCRVFKAKTGLRPMEYLAMRRAAEAKTLLAETQMKIGDVAQAVGFDDPNYFGITFRKYTGTTPTEYRRAFFGM